MNCLKLGCGSLSSNIIKMFKMEDFHDPSPPNFPQYVQDWLLVNNTVESMTPKGMSLEETALRNSLSPEHHWFNTAKRNARLAESKCNLSGFLTDTSEGEYLYSFRAKTTEIFNYYAAELGCRPMGSTEKPSFVCLFIRLKTSLPMYCSAKWPK